MALISWQLRLGLSLVVDSGIASPCVLVWLRCFKPEETGDMVNRNCCSDWCGESHTLPYPGYATGGRADRG